jgi:hypothetical protein
VKPAYTAGSWIEESRDRKRHENPMRLRSRLSSIHAA